METNISCEKHIRRIAESLIRIPMNMLHNGFFYSFPKEDTLRDDMFYDKCWFLIKSNPQTKNEIINSTYLADIYINMKYLFLYISNYNGTSCPNGNYGSCINRRV